MTKNNRSIAEKTAELNELVAWFDSDEFVLEQAIDKFKAAQKLATEIETDLDALRNEITVLEQSFDSEA